MRIPVSKSDLNDGKLTKCSRAVQKLWQTKLSLMQAQNVLAELLGYRNLNDLQLHVTDNVVPTSVTLSRQQIKSAVAWRLSRRHKMHLSTANEFTEKLHLENLSFDALTLDAAFERAQEDYLSMGKLLVMDEAGYMVDPHWHPKTPQLLDAKLPPYSYAVLSDHRVFRWSLLENLLSRLPSDFLDDLRKESTYQNLPAEKVESEFLRCELYPQSCESLLDTVKHSRILPNGFSITWIFTSKGDCIGRVLNNTSLGGIIPIIFGIEDDSVYHAASKILIGETISSPTDVQLDDGEPVYVLRLGLGGFDLANDIRTFELGQGKGLKVSKKGLIQLPSHIQYRIDDGNFVLLGSTFVERNQIYLRNQQWILPQDIPNIIRQTVAEPDLTNQQADNLYLQSTELIPTKAGSLYSAAATKTEQLLDNASKRLQTDEGIAHLIALFLRTAQSSQFDTYCSGLIDEALPCRPEGDNEDNMDLIEERDRELQNLEWNGQMIQEVIPELHSFKRTTLGMVLLLSNGEYPGSRYSNAVYPPKPDDHKALVCFLAGLNFHAVCCARNIVSDFDSADSKALNFILSLVIDGVLAPDVIPRECETMKRYRAKMSAQAKFLTLVQEWQRDDDQIRQVRSTENYLYVGKAISRQKPKGLMDVMSMARSKGFTVALKEQTQSAFDNPMHS